jgi:AcrR family transcriptional regulator
MSTRAYRSPSRTANANLTRMRIVDAAGTLLRAPEGFAQFSLEGVAKEARVTRMTVYKHFGSRRAILEAAFDDMATKGGLHRLETELSGINAREAVRRTITIFCDFWSFDRAALVRLHATGVVDQDFEASLRERNERRRHLLVPLVRAMALESNPGIASERELVDVLFALTSVHMFDLLTCGHRECDAVCQLLQDMACDAVARLGFGRSQ